MKFNRVTSLIIVCGGLFIAVSSSFTHSDRFFEIAKNIDIFASLYKEVNQFYVDEVSPTEMVNAGIEAMLATLDPYTNYIPEDQIEDYRTMTTGEYGGIGAIVANRKGKITIIMPNEGYAAHKAGLQIGDELLEADGVNVVGLDVSKISKFLKGQANTELKLLVKRVGVEEPFLVTLKREKIHIDNVPYFGMVDATTGYLQLTDFTRDASKEVKAAMNELKAQGAQKIIIDLRGNPGGLLSEAINISNLFLPKGSEVVKTLGRVEDWNKTHRALNNPSDLDIPVAVLVNGSSASASEIVSGVIQDFDRGVIIGQRTFGKGLVQATRPLSYNSKLKVTVAKYYIPSGRCIQEIDYSHKVNGVSEKTPDSLRTAFKTKNGRVVYDGGGITPDLVTELIDMPEIVGKVLEKDLLFDYANLYKTKNDSIASAESFELDEAGYLAFIAWLEQQEEEGYESRLAAELNQAEEVAKESGFYASIETELKAMKEKVRSNQIEQLKEHKDILKPLLEAEIASRYYLQRGKTKVELRNDLDVQEAITVLADQQKYNGILSGQN